MHDLTLQLDHLARSVVPDHPVPTAPGASPADDLRRGRTALRRRRTATVLGSAAAVAVLGVGAQAIVDTPSQGPEGGSSVPAAAAPGAAAPSELSAVDVRAGAYRLTAVPRGWTVQAGDSSSVAMTPAGGPGGSDGDAVDYSGTLVLTLVARGYGGNELVVDGETYLAVKARGGFSFVERPSRDGEPAGSLLAQYPTDAGLTPEVVAAVLDGATALRNANRGVG